MVSTDSTRTADVAVPGGVGSPTIGIGAGAGGGIGWAIVILLWVGVVGVSGWWVNSGGKNEKRRPSG